MIRLALFLLLAGALVSYSFWVYLRAELPVGGRRLLAAVRAAALLLVLALLFDPRLPWGGVTGADTRWVLLDASLSMGASAEGEGADAWSAARAQAEALEGEGWTLVPFGEGVGMAPTPDAGDAPPRSPTSELAPALRGAVEAGASEIRILSDLRLHDPVETGQILARATGSVSFDAFGEPVPNAGLAALRVADALRRDEPVEAEVDLFGDGLGGPADSVQIEVREEGRLVHVWSGTPPPAGLLRTVRMELPPPAGEGRVRYTATVLREGDAFGEDDRAVGWANVGFEEDGVVLVSLSPDWEPRWLLPVLEQVTGLPGSGFLRVGPDRFVRMGRATERAAPVDSAAVGQAAEGAGLLVVHGLRRETDPWGRALAARGGRVMAWPHDVAGAASVGVQVSPSQGGEWYASSNLPPSPVASELAGLDFAGLPPLTDFFLVPDPVGVRPPLQVQLGGTGRAEAAVILRQEPGRRMVVPLTRGYWRWAAREGAPRETYRRFWAALAGWLLAPDASVGTARVRPEAWVTSRGEAVRWLLPSGYDEVRLRVERGDSVVRDTTLAGSGPVSGGTLPPGAYSFRAAAPDGALLGEGRFDVARTTRELLPVPREPERPATSGSAEVPSEAGRPLRTASWPYLLIVLLLCAEWVGRRRVGLR